MKKSDSTKFPPENDKKVLQAAGNLVWMSRKTLGEEEAMNLVKEMKGKKKMKKKVLPVDGDGEESKYQNLPCPRRRREEPPPPPPPPVELYSVDGTKIPRYPPNLESKVNTEACGVPFEKQLTASDVKKGQGRLFMIKDHVKKWFMPLLLEEEEEEGGKEDIDKGIPVTTYDPQGIEYKMVFRRWAGGKYYVLNGGGWKDLYNNNGLEKMRDWVTVWMFRHRRSGKLCFAIAWKSVDTHSLVHHKPQPYRDDDRPQNKRSGM